MELGSYENDGKDLKMFVNGFDMGVVNIKPPTHTVEEAIADKSKPEGTSLKEHLLDLMGIKVSLVCRDVDEPISAAFKAWLTGDTIDIRMVRDESEYSCKALVRAWTPGAFKAGDTINFSFLPQSLTVVK